MNNRLGKVYLVGAGPGDVNYLTVRGRQLLDRAEVLVYDALADEALLQWVPATCLKLAVGKRGGQPSTPQAEIDRLLVVQCQQGKQVLRLKSGDPFIFGRSTSEIQALVQADCPFEVVPGISSVLAAPLLAGIPLTDPVLSRCFAAVSGHDPEVLDWEALARIETLVVLMGGRHLKDIVRLLQRHGRSPQTPIAIIRWAGRPQQRVWIATLGEIVQRTLGESLSPAAIVVGEVVRLREFLHPRNPVESRSSRFEAADDRTTMNEQAQGTPPTQPLAGQTILVTRSTQQSREFGDRLASAGARVISMPALEIVPPSSWEALDRSLAALNEFDWLILTSANGVEYFFKRLFARGKDTRALATVQVAVVGKKTAQSLKSYGVQADFIPPNFIADALVENFPESVKGKKILFPRVETGGREVLVQQLTQQGAEVVEVPAYESRCPDTIAPEALDALQQQGVDTIAFASSKTVKNFCRLVEKAGDISLDGVRIASIGPQTSATCQQLLGRVDVEAAEYTMDGLYRALLSLGDRAR